MIIDAGPGNTQSGIDDEQGIVGSALNKSILQIKKLVFQPFKRRARMGTTIDESVETGILVNHENVSSDFPVLDMKAFTAGVGNFRSKTK